MTEEDKRPENRETELANGYRQAFTASVAEILSTTPADATELIRILEANGKSVILEVSYKGDVNEYHGKSHTGIKIPDVLSDLIFDTFQDPRIIAPRIRLALRSARIDVINPYMPQLPFAFNNIPVTPGEGETERLISPYLSFDIDKNKFEAWGLKTTLETQETQIVRHPVPGTSFTFPFPETVYYNEPIPVSSSWVDQKSLTPDILEGLTKLAQEFPSISAASVSVTLPRTDYIDPF